MGRNRDQVWHVYATPNNPGVCPVLALATYIFANPSITNVDNFTKTNEDGIASDKLLRKIRVCFLHLEFAQVIWAHIPRRRGHAALPQREAQSAHQWSSFAYGQCGVWGR